MDVSASALVDVVAECFDEMEVKEKEPSISTILLNHENKFDPYDALSTPLYQTATFKQPSAIENGPYDYTRSGNPTRDALESLLAKLDKADRAFCFTSGMAALAAVAHLVGTGAFSLFFLFIIRTYMQTINCFILFGIQLLGFQE
ncbi:hypothetical protein CsSME_00045856 [Camellia sinensis var. sinensis]